jgi:phosphinothricin acetyltransferase
MSSSTTGFTLVDARPEHMAGVQRLYGHYVLQATCTFEEQPPDVAEMTRRWRELEALGLPYLVALVEGEVAGYAYAGRYRARSAYRQTLENSVYVAPGLHGRGIGRALLCELIERCTALGYWEMVAVIGDSANQASIRLHARLGFEHIGVLRDVGLKFGRRLDTLFMQRSLARP